MDDNDNENDDKKIKKTMRSFSRVWLSTKQREREKRMLTLKLNLSLLSAL